MSFYVNIDYGTTTAGIRTVSEKAICIIGKSSAFSGVVYNVQSVDDLSGAVSTDPIYVAVENALEILPSDAMIIAAGVVSGGTVYDDFLLNRGPDFWYSEYSPLLFASGERIYVAESGYTSGWYDIVSGFEWESVNGTLNGIANVDDDGLLISGSAGVYSGYTPGDDDKITADIGVPTLSEIFKELTSPEYRFQYFIFAYPEKETPEDPLITDDFKYKPEYCIGNNGWLADIYLGSSLASSFNRLNQRTMFIASLPDGVYPDTAIGDAYLNGTSVSGVKYADLPSLIQNEYVILTHGNVYQPETYDTALQMAGTRMEVNPRRSSLFTTPAGDTSLEVKISQPIINKWRTARINTIATSRASDTPVWHGNFTMSSDSKKGTINYMQAINLLAYDLEMAMYSLLYGTNPLKYDLNTMNLIESTAKSVCELHASYGYIDGYVGTTIPIKTLLAKEGDLTEGEQAVLDAARSSGVVDNITIRFLWNGDIEQINITLTGV